MRPLDVNNEIKLLKGTNVKFYKIMLLFFLDSFYFIIIESHRQNIFKNQ